MFPHLYPFCAWDNPTHFELRCKGTTKKIIRKISAEKMGVKISRIITMKNVSNQTM